MASYKSRDSYEKLYDILVVAEQEKRFVTRSAIAQSTGYKPGSVGAYIRNKLKNVYLFEVQPNQYEVRGIKSVTFESFAYHMSQMFSDN